MNIFVQSNIKRAVVSLIFQSSCQSHIIMPLVDVSCYLTIVPIDVIHIVICHDIKKKNFLLLRLSLSIFYKTSLKLFENCCAQTNYGVLVRNYSDYLDAHSMLNSFFANWKIFPFIWALDVSLHFTTSPIQYYNSKLSNNFLFKNLLRSQSFIR